MTAATSLRFAPELASDGSNLFEVERAVSNFASIIVSHLPSDWAGPRFSLHARADWAWVSAVLTRAAYGGDAVTAQPSVTFRYDAETPRWKAALAASVLALVLAIGGTYARRRWRARPSAESSFIAPVDSSTEGG